MTIKLFLYGNGETTHHNSSRCIRKLAHS